MTVIATARVRLRPVRLDDAPAISAMMTPNVSRWTGSWPTPLSTEAAGADTSDTRILSRLVSICL